MKTAVKTEGSLLLTTDVRHSFERKHELKIFWPFWLRLNGWQGKSTPMKETFLRGMHL